MPLKSTTAKARKDKRQGKSASTQAGEYVREEIDTIRKGKHGARSAKQAIAIGLSNARRAGVPVPPKGAAKTEARPSSRRSRPSAKRSRATSAALRREPTSTVSSKSLSLHSRSVAKKRGASARHRSAMKAAGTRHRTRG